MHLTQQATGRKEAVGLIYKTAKLKPNLIAMRWCSLLIIDSRTKIKGQLTPFFILKFKLEMKYIIKNYA